MNECAPAGLKVFLPQLLELVVSHVLIFYQVDAWVPAIHALELVQANMPRVVNDGSEGRDKKTLACRNETY